MSRVPAPSDDDPEFGVTPDEGPVPRFVAVSDGRRGIAGYVERAMFEGTDRLPASPEEGLARQRVVRGEIFRVFDTQANVVGYWASDHQFIDETEKDHLVARGWEYLLGDEPTPDS